MAAAKDGAGWSSAGESVHAAKGARGRLVRSLIAGSLWLMGTAFASERAEAGYTAFIDQQRLFIRGDAAGDDLAIALQAGAPTVLVVDVGADGSADFSFDRGLFNQILVSAGGGNDRVRIAEDNGVFTDTEATSIDGGDGDDALLGGTGVEVFLGGAGKDIVDGNGGDGDTFVWDPGDGSDAVDGQEGTDAIEFNGSDANETFTLSANGPLLRFFHDFSNILMHLDGVERIGVRTLGGMDNVVVNDLAGTDVALVSVNFAGVPGGDIGDGQPDSVFVHGTTTADAIQIAPAPRAVPAGGVSAESKVASSASAEASADTLSRPIIVTGLTAKVRVERAEQANDRVVINGIGNDLVKVNGSAAADIMELIASAGFARVIVTGFTASVDVMGSLTLSLNGLGGSDQFSSVGNLAGLGIPLRMDGGPGDDVIRGSNGADTLVGGAGDDFVDGNQGVDTAFLGDGEDSFQWDPGDGNDVVEGENGTDTLVFNGSGAGENVDLSANGERLRFFRNVANIVMDVGGVEAVDFQALGGADTVVVNDLRATEVTQVNVDLASFVGGNGGDAQIDTVMVNGTSADDTFDVEAVDGEVIVTSLGAEVRLAHAEIANDRVAFNGVGNDLVNVNGTEAADTMELVPSVQAGHAQVVVAGFTASVDVIGALMLSVNGLGGPDLIGSVGNLAALGIPIRIDGGDGDDFIRGGNAADTIFGGAGDDFVDGNQGGTRLSSATAKTRSNGTRATETTLSRAKTAQMRWFSTARGPTRSLISPPTASGFASSATWPTSPWT